MTGSFDITHYEIVDSRRESVDFDVSTARNKTIRSLRGTIRHRNMHRTVNATFEFVGGASIGWDREAELDAGTGGGKRHRQSPPAVSNVLQRLSISTTPNRSVSVRMETHS